MMKRWRTLTTAAALSAGIVFGASTAHAQECLPGIDAAYAVYADRYDAINAVLQPELDGLQSELAALTDQATYQTLLSHARTIVGSIATGRLVVTVPDGTVVLDTARSDGDPSNPQSNTYQHFLNKTINENHNSRVAIFSAQQWPCGRAIESKLSTTDGVREWYSAYRLGNHLDNLGTARLSTRQ
jgi:hypothetical protein